MSNIVEAKNIFLGYKNHEAIIKNASFDIEQKSFNFITGHSGSGKSTLLKSLYGNMQLTDGFLQVCGMDLRKINNKKLNLLRRHIGIVFQDYKLIKEWNVKKNVILPLLIAGFSNDVCEAQTEKLLAHIKLSHKADKYPQELSGGEQQRVAMA
ncbi:MAG: ATP-binding cassette domain-containing protein, partial [Campylobacterales bacterium]|nr:ATP-binding cassette domain-containing protein [Campylobacterales bacterium]